jgi:phosphatidylglycerophosphate synthase
MPRWVFFFISACVFLYMVFDALDGLRARKFKMCSPLGRIIDEAGDSMQYAF